MDVDSTQRVAFLKKIHLFNGLDEVQTGVVAQELKETTHQAETDIISEGEKGDRLYLIFTGSVSITKNNKEIDHGTLVVGDYFGEEALLNNQSRHSTITTQEETLLLSLSREQLFYILKQVPKLKINFEVSIASRQLARKKQFNWLEPDEVVYFLARKHQILLWQSLTMPVISFAIPVALLVFISLKSGQIPVFVANVALIVAGIVSFLIAGLVVWRWIDWGNDYYIVTNRRVIWLEKVVGIYDSREEAPLNTVLSIGVQTDQLGRWLDYGDVVIRTFVGKIKFHHVHHPNQAAALVEEHWGRAKMNSRKSDMEFMKQTIRQKLGLPSSSVAVPEKSERLISESPYKPSALALAISNIFKLRYESGSTITYRKHWVVLVENVWQPTVLFLTGLIVVFWFAYDWVRVPANGSLDQPIILVVGALLVPIFLWWLYQYINWSNDIFQVTEDQIVDIDKTPLGRADRKAAPLDNILTTESQRNGFLQVLWNYGDVLITVGAAQLCFEDVRDPASVQQDIDRRRLARIEQKKKAEAAAERERVADWFVSYHHSAEEMRNEQNPDTPDEKESDEVQ